MPDAYLSVILIIFVALTGLCLGSFTTALIYRIPRRISWIVNKSDSTPSRSCCPQCGRLLGVCDLIPFFSWAFSSGKCRYCKKKISFFYPVVELTTVTICLALYAAWGAEWAVIPLILCAPFFIAAVVIDWEYMILPDDINIVLTVLSFAYIGFIWNETGFFPVDNIYSAVALPLILGGVSWILGKIKGRSALGMGDMKFLPAAGLLLGVSALPTYLGLSGVLGIMTAALRRALTKNAEFPFGPALIISLYIHLILTGLGFDYTW